MRKFLMISMLSTMMAVSLAGCQKTETATTENTVTETTTEETTKEESTKETTTEETKAEQKEMKEGDSLIIPISELSEKAKFYPVTVDGTAMEVIAVKDSEGTIRTAFNTCQVCYDSGNGYYKQEGEELVCQNCGNSFTMDQVGETSGGCNPWPILEEDRTVTETEIQISYDFLKESSDIFSNWKR